MKTLQYIGTFDTGILREQLLAEFPEWRIVNGNIIIEYFDINYDALVSTLTLIVPEDADENLILQILDIHDPTARIYTPLDWNDVLNARLNFLNLPNWATWTAQEANTFVRDDILSGMTKEQIELWVDTNVINLETAKVALKLVGGELVDLREICMRVAEILVYLRDVAIRRRL